MKFLLLAFLCFSLLAAQTFNVLAERDSKNSGNTKYPTAYGDHVTIEGTRYFINSRYEWYDALKCNEFCLSLNMTLRFENQHKWLKVTDFLMSNGYDDRFYMSGGRVYNNWIWSGPKVEEFTFTAWGASHPSKDPIAMPICVTIDERGIFTDIDCATPWSYICEEVK